MGLPAGSKISTRPLIVLAEAFTKPNVVAHPPEIANCGKTIVVELAVDPAGPEVGIVLNSIPEKRKAMIDTGVEL